MTATGTEDYVTEYSYSDSNGSYTALLQKEVKTVESDENLFTSETKQTVYTYDANGNQITKTAEGKTETNTYDGLNQLIGFTDGETTASYKYNVSGLRYEKTVNGQTINHVWDGNQQIVADVIDNQFYEANCYIRGTNLVAKYNYRNGEKSEYTYYTQNAHGDVVNLTDETGKVTKTYTYDAFGVEKNIDENDTNAFRYCGEYFDKETGTIYLRARYYNPSNGRFISRDSYAGKLNDPLSLNLYTYCQNNPLIFTDPSGHFTEAISDTFSSLAKAVSEAQELIRTVGVSILTSAKNAAPAYGTCGGIALADSPLPGPCDVIAGSAFAALTAYVAIDGLYNGCEQYIESKTAEKDDADAIEKEILFPRLPDEPTTYYHATTLENALKIQSTNILKGDKWEGGYVYAWKRKPSKKALKLSGAKSLEVIISFQTYSAFAPDPAFSGGNTDLSIIERAKINSYFPVRSCISGDVYVSNVQIIE